MTSWNYTKGLHEVGNGVYAYLQPDGGWGWSNAGLLVDGDRPFQPTSQMLLCIKSN